MEILEKIENDDPDFVDDLKNSQQWVDRAAAWLNANGIKTEVAPLRIRPDIEEWKDYSDSGDLRVTLPAEVKHREEIDFTCADDFPFPTVIVDKRRKYDRMKVKPLFHMIISASGNHFIFIPKHTKDKWIKTTRFDSNAKRDIDYYECPLEYVAFYKMDLEE